jgi:DNA-binding PadR family transcriptional regulator
MSDSRRTGKGYLEHHTGLYNFPVPKGLLGYDGKTPSFSTKEMVTLWLLQIMADGEPWYGKALIEEIRQRTKCEGFGGYSPSNGVVFGLLKQWNQAGMVRPCEQAADRSPGRRPSRYLISDEGRTCLELMKGLHCSQVAAGAHIFGRLWLDLYGRPAPTRSSNMPSAPGPDSSDGPSEGDDEDR